MVFGPAWSIHILCWQSDAAEQDVTEKVTNTTHGDNHLVFL